MSHAQGETPKGTPTCGALTSAVDRAFRDGTYHCASARKWSFPTPGEHHVHVLREFATQQDGIREAWIVT